MMPLTLANPGEENLIRKVGGSPEVKKHLEDIGFQKTLHKRRDEA